MNEERNKTIVESPTIQMERESIKVSDKLLPNSLPKTATRSVKHRDKVDKHVFAIAGRRGRRLTSFLVRFLGPSAFVNLGFPEFVARFPGETEQGLGQFFGFRDCEKDTISNNGV